MNQQDFRRIPAVGEAVHWDEFADLIKKHPRPLLVRTIAAVADQCRDEIRSGADPDLSREGFALRVREHFARIARPRLRRVVNATGTIVHTNLGRSILAKEAMEAVMEAAGGYSTLEYDLDAQKRGSRHTLISDLICEITGAEAAIAVNNNAAAVLLSLNALAQGREVVVSRGELVEIGGSFRVPDVMAKSGCTMVEVGTTNKTHAKDYRNAVTDRTALLLKVHASNYRIVGFTAEVKGADLVQIGQEMEIPVMEDLGSGFIHGAEELLAGQEPSVGEVVRNGLDVITFSGDKLLGGPQAGIILGKSDLVEKIAKNPIARAVRCDKMTLAALEATLRIYRDPERALKEIPTLKLAGASLKVLREKARRIAAGIRKTVGNRAEVAIRTTSAQVGGGAMPLLNLPSAAVSIQPKEISVAKLDFLMHRGEIPVIGRIENDHYLLDVRTLLDGETKIVQNAVIRALKEVK